MTSHRRPGDHDGKPLVNDHSGGGWGEVVDEVISAAAAGRNGGSRARPGGLLVAGPAATGDEQPPAGVEPDGRERTWQGPGVASRQYVRG
ncbi:MAG: hypothetical protein ACR2FU_23530, partial [Streptosporangiaceae bacterium]